MHTNLEQVSCAVCGNDDTREVWRKRTAPVKIHTIVQCRRCGLVYVNPRLSQAAVLDTYRDSSYFQRGAAQITGYSDYAADHELHALFFREQLARLEQRGDVGKILDVGCAFGYLLDEARQRGWETEGVELSGNAVAHAREKLRLKIHDAPLRDIGFPAGAFDALVMNDVIEHYGDPAAEVREVHRVLKVSGRFLLHTPNFDSWWRPLMGTRWVHLKPEEHLYYFAPRTITRLLEQNGFAVEYARACGKITNLNYILGVLKKYSPSAGELLRCGFGRLSLTSRPFHFRGGGMEILAVKR